MSLPAPQHLVALDLEGVVTPEIWITLAEHTGIDGLRRTTRDEPDYSKLMAGRKAILDREGIRFSDIYRVVEAMEPFPGAVEFLHRLRSLHPVVVVSDTYEQLAEPLFAKLGTPFVVCHRLTVAEDRIVGTEVRVTASKRRTVEAFRDLGYTTLAFGDSHNDLAMIRAADHGLLFRPPPAIAAAETDLPIATTYDQVLAWVSSRTA